MGAEDMARQALNVFRMRLLGAEVVQVDAGSRTLKDAINEAMRDWVANVDDTYYLLGSVLGPHPYPLMVREFQSVIGQEARAQIARRGRPAARHRRGLRGRRQQRHRHLRRLRRRSRRCGWSASKPAASDRARPSTRRGSPAASPACCRARARSCCRTRTATSSRRTRSRPGSTTRRSAPSTPGCAALGRTGVRPCVRRREALEAFQWLARARRHPAGAGVRARRGRRAAAGAPSSAPTASCSCNLSGRGDKDVRDGAGTAWRRWRRLMRATFAERLRARSGRRGSSPTSRPATPTCRARPTFCGRSTAAAPTSSRSACRFPIRWPTARRFSAPPSARWRPAGACGRRWTWWQSVAAEVSRADRALQLRQPAAAPGRRGVRRAGGRGRASTACCCSTCRSRRPARFARRRWPAPGSTTIFLLSPTTTDARHPARRRGSAGVSVRHLAPRRHRARATRWPRGAEPLVGRIRGRDGPADRARASASRGPSTCARSAGTPTPRSSAARWWQRDRRGGRRAATWRARVEAFVRWLKRGDATEDEDTWQTLDDLRQDIDAIDEAARRGCSTSARAARAKSGG